MRQLLSSQRTVPLIKCLLVVVFVVWASLQSRYVYDSYKIRQRVMEGLKMATLAKVVVEGNATKGLALNSGWLVHPSNEGVVVSISQNAGVITVAYGANVDGGGRTLTLVPLSSLSEGGYAFSGNASSSSFLLPAQQVFWVCASANTITRNTTVLKHKGTLPTKYAPLECRH